MLSYFLLAKKVEKKLNLTVSDGLSLSGKPQAISNEVQIAVGRLLEARWRG